MDLTPWLTWEEVEARGVTSILITRVHGGVAPNMFTKISAWSDTEYFHKVLVWRSKLSAISSQTNSLTFLSHIGLITVLKHKKYITSFSYLFLLLSFCCRHFNSSMSFRERVIRLRLRCTLLKILLDRNFSLSWLFKALVSGLHVNFVFIHSLWFLY